MMLRRIIQLSFVLFCTMAYILMTTPPVSALEAGDVVVSVQPGSHHLNLVPGQTTTGVLRVGNVGRKAFTFTLSTSPYQVADESYDPDFATENDYTKLVNWISFPQKRYTIDPGEELEVKFVITVPANTPGGGQYAAIIVETRDGIEEDAMLKVVNHVASIIYAHVEGDEHVGGVIIDQTLSNILMGKPFSASVTIKNDGNVHFRADHTLTIYNFFTNREVFSPDAIDLNGQTPGHLKPIILPATQRTSTITWEGAPKLGLFRAIERVTFLDQTYEYERVVLLCPGWLAGGAAFLLALMVIWLIVRFHRRRRNKPQVI